MRGLSAKTYTALVLLVAGISVGAGILTAVLLNDGESITAPQAQAEVVTAPSGLPLKVLQEADERVSFPAELEGLGLTIEKLAVGPDGLVWIPSFTGGESGHLLYGYDPASGEIKSFSLPGRPGSGLSSAIGISASGQPVLAYGGIVTVLNPVSGSFTTYELPPVSKGGHVTDISIGSDNTSYVTRENTSAISVVDLTTGNASEIEVEAASGEMFDVEVLGDDVYVAHWITGGDIYDPSTGGTGLIRLGPDGTQEVLDGSSWAIARAGDSLYSIDLEGQVRAYVDQSLSGAVHTQVTQTADQGIVAVETQTGDLWIAGRFAASVVHWHAGSQSQTAYALPVYLVDASAIRCPPLVECGDSRSPTMIGDLAVAPNGDVWFTDTTLQRVGVIHP